MIPQARTTSLPLVRALAAGSMPAAFYFLGADYGIAMACNWICIIYSGIDSDMVSYRTGFQKEA